MLSDSEPGGPVTRILLVEIVVMALAVVLGYGSVTFAQRGVNAPTPTPPRPGEPSTATVAPAITFTPAPTIVAETPTPTQSPTEPPSTDSPTASPTRPTPTKTPTPAPTPIAYVVQAGDSLDGISRKFSVSTDAIMRANHMSDPDSLVEGQKLLIPRK